VAELARVCEGLLAAAVASGVKVVVVSEYAISSVSRAIAPNRLLYQAGLLKLRRNAEGPQIDYAASPAFVLCDHQIGHVYLRRMDDRDRVVGVLTEAGIEVVEPGISHPRAGEVQVQAPEGAWLDYRWWEESMTPGSHPEVVPVWATQIDIHRKPGYDPLELFFGGKPMPPPAPPPPIATDSRLIRGSHGRAGVNGVLVCPAEWTGSASTVRAVDVAALIRGVW
jgi:hypothetical protein